MALADNVAHFLVEHGGQGFCDQCLARHLGYLRTAQVQRATKQMAANPAFRRDSGVCATCANERQIIFALWPGF
jgi:hypothetical protein